MNTIDQIRQEIEDCEYIQNTNESDYTKEQAKLSAYEHIREIVCGKEQEYTLLDFKPYLDLWIEEKRKRGYIESEYIFSKPNGQTMTTARLDTFAKTITRYLGKPFYFHALRHQLCTRLFRLGLPSDVIQSYFGWSSAEMLNVYNDSEAEDSFGQYFTAEGIKGIS